MSKVYPKGTNVWVWYRELDGQYEIDQVTLSHDYRPTDELFHTGRRGAWSKDRFCETEEQAKRTIIMKELGAKT